MNYPYAKPRAHFLNSSHIYHPLVHARTGEINLDYEFPEWLPGKHWAVNVLLSIKKMLHLQPYYLVRDDKKGDLSNSSPRQQISPTMVFNKEAHQTFQDQFEEVFVERC